MRNHDAVVTDSELGKGGLEGKSERKDWLLNFSPFKKLLINVPVSWEVIRVSTVINYSQMKVYIKRIQNRKSPRLVSDI